VKIYTVLVSVVIAFPLPRLEAAEVAKSCPVGMYRFKDGRTIDVASSDDQTLRWLMFTGERGQLHPEPDGGWTSTYGWTSRSDGKKVSFSQCGAGEITFNNERGRRIDFDVHDSTFESSGVSLVGRLVMPKGAGRVPIVVLVHGSEHDSALNSYALQRLFPSQGVGAFVYDKRGTGASGGSYTQDFEVLARDGIAAMQTAKQLAGARLRRIGYQGGSQGGWVVPLAANLAPVDFAIVSFGLAVTILEEDQESVALNMYFHHHSAEDTTKALELARAGERLFETGGHEGYDQFNALRERYRSEPWYKDVHGDFLFFILPLDQAQIVDAMTKDLNFVEARTPFRYEPMPTLEASTTQQLWILGSDDLDAPSAETAKRIKSLIARGKPYTLAVYPGAEHGMTEYEIDANGDRVSTRFAPDYFQMMADFIRDGRIKDHYGNAAIDRVLRSAAGMTTKPAINRGE
jgi:dienelactone hydrolase